MDGDPRPAGDIRYKVRQISAAAAAGMIEEGKLHREDDQC